MKRYFGYKNSDKKGFTLAEVLITIGVIGVVAAMTIPTLMMDYQRKVWEARLKKAFSVTVNACERMLVEENVSAANETQLYLAVTDATIDKNTAVRRYFKVLRDGSEETNGFLIALPDGADLFYTTDATAGVLGFNFYVDVNGDASNPNNPGRDIFQYSLDRNCTYSPPAAGASQAALDFDYVVNNNWVIPSDPNDYPVAP